MTGMLTNIAIWLVGIAVWTGFMFAIWRLPLALIPADRFGIRQTCNCVTGLMVGALVQEGVYRLTGYLNPKDFGWMSLSGSTVLAFGILVPLVMAFMLHEGGFATRKQVATLLLVLAVPTTLGISAARGTNYEQPGHGFHVADAWVGASVMADEISQERAAR